MTLSTTVQTVAALSMLLAIRPPGLPAADATPSNDTYLNLSQAVRVSSGWGTARNNASVEGKSLRIGKAALGNDAGFIGAAALGAIKSG